MNNLTNLIKNSGIAVFYQIISIFLNYYSRSRYPKELIKILKGDFYE